MVQALGWSSSRRIRLVSLGLPRRGRPLRGRWASPGVPWRWQWRTQGRRGGAGEPDGVGVHAGGAHTSGGLVGSVVLWKASATREATASAPARYPQLGAEPMANPL